MGSGGRVSSWEIRENFLRVEKRFSRKRAVICLRKRRKERAKGAGMVKRKNQTAPRAESGGRKNVGHKTRCSVRRVSCMCTVIC